MLFDRPRVKSAALLCALVCCSCATASGANWESIHEEMQRALAALSNAYFAGDSEAALPAPRTNLGVSTPQTPQILVVGFTGGIERRESKASGVVAMKSFLSTRAGPPEVLPMTFNNFHWRKAAAEVLEIVRVAQENSRAVWFIRQPLIVVYGHSWGAGSIAKFARELKEENIEISLAVYIDAFTLRNPRLPANIRCAVNFYQRAGIFKGLPVRGKRKLIPEDPSATHVLGSFRIDPQAKRWGWSWNLLVPLLFRQHHRIAHDVRLHRYVLEIVNLKLDLLGQLIREAPAEIAFTESEQ